MAIFSEKYKMTNVILGSGHSCKVKKCVRILDNEVFACKIIDKLKLTPDQIQLVVRETAVLAKLRDVKYCIQLVDFYDTNDKLYIVLPLCEGNDLFHYIVKHCKDGGKVKENKVARIFYQIISVVHLCHLKGIVHRDIKPENILFVTKGKLNVVLTDFGLSSDLKNNIDCNGTRSNLMFTKCGTPHYVAPELLNQIVYSKKCDWWSCGVLLYVMLSGKFPFWSDNSEKLYQQIEQGLYDFNDEIWSDISLDAKNLVTNLLQIDPKNRFSYQKIIKHPFLVKNLKNKKPLKPKILKLSTLVDTINNTTIPIIRQSSIPLLNNGKFNTCIV